ncbi:MAG: NfeD family protein [Clostridia bacterium]|nr:NfeD family protein [Clostridia bacterium]
MDWIWIWAIIVAVSLLIEFFTMELISIWIAVGGLVALILAAIGGINPEIQIICAILVSLGCILGLRRFALKHLNKKSESSIAEPLLGKKAKLIEPCGMEKDGSIKLNGIIWTVYSDSEILQNEEIEVIKVKGNKLKVKQVEIKQIKEKN